MTSSKTGLFSAIVSAFLIEFYKTLLPDSTFGHQSVALFKQISEKLANFLKLHQLQHAESTIFSQWIHGLGQFDVADKPCA